jgi:sugar O-acyltransferase (sialic acid O-acetyltransferase NeuD family)
MTGPDPDVDTKRIYCAGDQGRVVLDILRAGGDAGDIAFVDDDEAVHGTSVDGVPVLGSLQDIEAPGGSEWLVAYGGQGQRLDLAGRVADRGGSFFSAVHPDATVSSAAALGAGVTVNARSYVGPGASLAAHVLVDSCVNVSHDVSLDRGATVTPNATLAGDVTVGVDAYVGPGATVLRGREVGDGAVVGAGAVVTEDVPADTTVIGVPAAER